MQQPRPMLSPVPAHFPSSNITTEQIQSFLDENKNLILAILDNQNLGKLAECAQYQAKLQQNLMYLAAIADAQPPTASVPSQVPPHAVMQPGGPYMQHPQLAAVQQQMLMSKVAMQLHPLQIQDQQQLQHQHSVIQAQMGVRPGSSNGLHALHAEGVANNPSDGRGNKQPGGTLSEVGNSDDGRGNSISGPSGVNGDHLWPKVQMKVAIDRTQLIVQCVKAVRLCFWKKRRTTLVGGLFLSVGGVCF